VLVAKLRNCASTQHATVRFLGRGIHAEFGWHTGPRVSMIPGHKPRVTPSAQLWHYMNPALPKLPHGPAAKKLVGVLGMRVNLVNNVPLGFLGKINAVLLSNLFWDYPETGLLSGSFKRTQ